MSLTYEYPEEVVRARNEERQLLLEIADAVERLRHPMTSEEFQTALRNARLAKARFDAAMSGDTT